MYLNVIDPEVLIDLCDEGTGVETAQDSANVLYIHRAALWSYQSVLLCTQFLKCVFCCTSKQTLELEGEKP